jgi:hypothetical protein
VLGKIIRWKKANRTTNNKLIPSTRSRETWGIRSKLRSTSHRPTKTSAVGNRYVPHPKLVWMIETQLPVRLPWLAESRLSSVRTPTRAIITPAISSLRSRDISPKIAFRFVFD